MVAMKEVLPKCELFVSATCTEGLIDGFESFIGIDGEMYKGSWVADRKHERGSGVGEGVYGRLPECHCSRIVGIN